MKLSALNSIILAAAMMFATCLSVQAAPVQTDQDTIKKSKTKKAGKIKQDTAEKRTKQDTV